MAKLTIVPTPVGNLEDMTFRAIRVLKEADLVLAEDTRTTGILFKHFEIQNKMQSHHKFNEHKTVEQLAARIKAGENIALVSDAGTPAISDPGAKIVDSVRKAGINVVPVPGPSAVITALSASDASHTFKLRVGGYVRDFSHGETLVLSDGDEICAVSSNVILR